MASASRNCDSRVFFRVPAVINLIDMLPPQDCDYAAYLLDTLHRKLLSWRVDDRYFCRLKWQHITRFIPRGRWGGIRSTLQKHGVVDIDRSYVVGERSIGYRLDPRFWRSRLTLCRNPQLALRIDTRRQEREARLRPVHRWLKAKFDNLQFDHRLARRIIPTMRPDDGSRIAVADYHVLLTEICKRFHYAKQIFQVDDYGRCHSAITNLPAEFRPCLTVNGEHLTGLDLANSQPLICGTVAQRFQASKHNRKRMRNRRFHARTSPYVAREIASNRDGQGEGERPTTGRGGKDRHARPNMSPVWAENPTKAGICSRHEVPLLAKSGDLGRYLALCERGELYEYLMEPGEDRDCMKVRLFRDVLYGQNRFRSPLKERFEREFRTMAAMLRFLKQGDYRQSARLMQSYESTIFIAIICRRLMEERPELPVFTIHDSVLTRPSDAEYVRSVILDEFGKLGVTPTLKEEQHGPAR